MKHILKTSYAALLILLCTTLLGSCGGSAERSLLSTIPVSSRCMVAAINLDYAIKASGSELDPSTGELNLSDISRQLLNRISGGIATDDILLQTGDFLRYIDRSFVVSYNGQDGVSFITFRITSRDEIIKTLELHSQGVVEKLDDISFYSFGSYRVGVLDNQGWIFNGEPRELTALLDETANADIEDFPAVRDFFSDCPTVKIGALTEVGDATSGQNSRWRLVSLHTDGLTAEITANTTAGDGNPVALEGTAPVSDDFLRYFPADMNLVMAFGHTTDDIDVDDFDFFIEMYAAYLRPYVSFLRPYLPYVDGTVAVGVKANLEDVAAGRPPQGITMIRMGQEKLDKAIGDITRFISTMGISPAPGELPGEKVFDLTTLSVGLQLHVAPCDGYLTLATFTPKADCQNSYAPVFEGKNGGALLNIPTLAPIIPGCDMGIDASMQVEPEKSFYRIHITNSGDCKTFEEALIRIFDMALAY